MKRLIYLDAILLVCFFVIIAGSAFASDDHDMLQTGKPLAGPRFIVNNNGTITDKLTGLTWLKDADCFGAKTWDDALSLASGLANGQCELSDGSKAGHW